MRFIDELGLQFGENTRILRIILGAKETLFAGMMANGVCKIRLKAVPEKGKANQELLSFLAQQLAIPQKNIEILSGRTSQNKTLKIFL